MKLIDLGAHGWLYTPDTASPGILVLHGGEGSMSGWAHRFAAILAAHGYAALAYPYAPGGSVFQAGPIRDVPLENTVAALAALRAHPACNGSVGIFGWSKGGEHTLLIATEMARRGISPLPDAIAAHAPFDAITPAFDPASLIPGGAPAEPGGTAWQWEGSAEGLEPGTRVEIETFPNPVFLSVGLADELTDATMTLRIAETLTEAGRLPDLLTIEGQGHAYDAVSEPILWARLTSFFRANLPQSA